MDAHDEQLKHNRYIETARIQTHQLQLLRTSQSKQSILLKR